VLAAEIGAWAIEQEAQRLRVFLELVLALADGREWDAVRRELDVIPSGAETAIRATAGEVIDRAERLRENTRNTRQPTRTFVVSTAAAVSVAIDSKQSTSPPCGGVS
jgi:hypothetical protein